MHILNRHFVTRRQRCIALGGLVLAAMTGQSHQSQLYRLEEKKRDKARGRTDGQSSKSKKDAGIEMVIGKIDSARMNETLKALMAFPTRWSKSPTLAQARDFIKQQFIGFGYDANRVQFVEYKLDDGGTVGRSVICAPEQLDQSFVLIGAHYDSISETPGVSAPGADDDGSGIAVVLEMARIFAGVGLKRGVMFAAFGGEEQGLFGSQAVADQAARDRWASQGYVEFAG
jgi:acetylornithine deacetylase/succinyl-diaminopimelate desuccinylase-like protein